MNPPAPPAFQFYPDDFIAGTCDMSPREVGVYILFLCVAWSKGSLPNDEKRLFILARTSNEPENEAANEAAVRYVVSDKFVVCHDGRLRNERLEKVREENSQWREKSIAGGKMSAAKRVGNSQWGKIMSEQRSTKRSSSEPTTNSPSPSPSPSPMQEREPNFPECNGNPTLKEVLAKAEMIGLLSWKAEDWFNEMQGCGWLDFQHRPVRDWASVLTRVKVKWEADGRPTGPPGISPAKTSVFSITKVIEAKTKLADELKRKHASEGPLSTDWSPPEKRTEYLTIRGEIKQLTRQLAGMA
jgi:uncharacterized protein YdaU (DUF1376 family)